MILAEALMERADLQKEIHRLTERLNNNARVEVGAEPVENPQPLIDELKRLHDKYGKLVERINRTNYETMVDGVRLDDLILERNLAMKLNHHLQSFVNEATRVVERWDSNHAVMRPSVDVAPIRKEIGAASQKIRQMDIRIQKINWTTELL